MAALAGGGRLRICSLLIVSLLCSLAWPIPALGISMAPALRQRDVTVEIRYQMPDANEVFLVWGLGDWEQVPFDQRPAGTRLRNGMMHTPMAGEDGQFAVQLEVPFGEQIRYGFLITETSTGQEIEVWDAGIRGEYLLIASRDFSIGTHSKLSLAPVSLDVRYQMDGASEVFFVWGINGWNAVPAAQLPAGTTIEKGTMHTPMRREGDAFVATLQLAPHTQVNYGFLLTKTHDGSPISVWEREPSFRTQVREGGGLLDVDSALRLEGEQALATLTEAPPVTLEIHYHAPGADEVTLVWGVNGWFPIPEGSRPEGTIIEEGMMRTAMDRQGGPFLAKLTVPAQTRVDFGFMVEGTEGGNPIRTWDGSDDYRIITTDHGLVVTVDSQVSEKPILGPEPVLETVLYTQEIRYHQPEAQRVFLVWDLEDRDLVPEGKRPVGTVVYSDGFHTPMTGEGQTFVAKVEVPSGTDVDYRFLITESSGGTAVRIWDDAAGSGYRMTVTGDDVIEIESAALPQQASSINTTRIGLYLLLLGTALLLGVGAALLFRWTRPLGGD